MTNEQKEDIRRMRLKGKSYREISIELALPIGSVKTFCKRGSLQSSSLQAREEVCQEFSAVVLCKQCDNLLLHRWKQKPKQFCSDLCRNKWWNARRNESDKKNIRHLICKTCGTEYESYDMNRKYCCHACYVKDRYGKERKSYTTGTSRM